MERISRQLKPDIEAVLDRGKSVLLLGPRQVGKTTLLDELDLDQRISLARPALRQKYEQNIDSFTQEVEALALSLNKIPLVAVDEVQKVPEFMDAAQDLIDRKIAQFILTGSSARKLRKQSELNWLPGRVVYFHLDPLLISELPSEYINLEELLIYGSLPGIVVDKNNINREQDLESYVVTYLEEEVRLEAVVRKLGEFAKFLRFAASESGQLSNFNKISRDVGVAQTTISSYYQILEDCLIAERIEPFSRTSSVRRRIVKSAKYLFFDLGIRRVAAHEGIKLPDETMGRLLEQFVGLELLRLIRNKTQRFELNFWRDLEGREVDWVISSSDTIIPIEVKWTDNPSKKHIQHLMTFMKDYSLDRGFIICRCDKPRKLNDKIIALPWLNIQDVFL